MKNGNGGNIEGGGSDIEPAGKGIIGGSKPEIAENFLNEEQQKLRGEIQVMLEEEAGDEKIKEKCIPFILQHLKPNIIQTINQNNEMKNIVMQIIKYQYSYKSEKTCDKENDISNIVQNEYLKLFNLIYKICKEKYNEISRFETPENVCWSKVEISGSIAK